MEALSRKEKRRLRKQTKEKQKEQAGKRTKRANFIQKLSLSFFGLAVLVGLGYWGYAQWSRVPIGEFVPSLGNRHISSAEMAFVTYNSDPPTSGPHLPAIAPWGIHENPIPKALQVHNLEDGGVLVQYNCSRESPACQELIDKLATIVRRYDHAILAPYPGMSHKIALTAWSRIDKFDDFEEQRVVRFIDAYINIDHHVRK